MSIKEGSYLEHEQAVAKAALSELKSELIRDVTLSANPGPWAREFPWASLGVALAGGLAAAAVVKPAVLGRSAPEPVNGWHPPAYDYEWEPAKQPPRRGILAAAVLTPVLGLLKSTIKSAIVAAVSAKAAQASAETEISGERDRTNASSVTAATASTTH